MTQSLVQTRAGDATVVTCNRCGATAWDPGKWSEPIQWRLHDGDCDYCPQCTCALGLRPGRVDLAPPRAPAAPAPVAPAAAPRANAPEGRA